MFLGGMVVFWMIDVAVGFFLARPSQGTSPTTGLLFALAMAGLAAILYRSGSQYVAAGIAAGYAVMTVVTGGACTFWHP